jgi:sugar phosphate isomerase/epimerase
VQLTPSFPGLGFHSPGDVTPERCRRAAEPFAALGIPVACLHASTNLLEPDLPRRHRGILRLHALLRGARDFGTRFVVTETGSLSPHGSSEPYPPNQSREAWAELRVIVAEAVRVAAGQGATLLLKADRGHVLASADDAVRLGEELPDPCLGFAMDPATFLLGTAAEELPAATARLVARLGPRTPVVHAKDLRPDEGGVSLPPVGQGVLDYALLLRLLDLHQPEAPVILEHLRPDEVPAARTAMERSLP